MTEGVLRLLRCPFCRGNMGQSAGSTVFDAVLLCADCGRSYPVVNGVPRLAVDHEPGTAVAESFGFQWRARAWRLFERDTLYGLSADAERRNFFDALGIGQEALTGRNILDAGCGDGFLLTVLAKYSAEVVGIDISTSIDIPYQRCRELTNVSVLQANLFSPPFPPASFDYVWCEGVLVHTEDPRRGFRNLADLVKPGGRLYVWVYPSDDLNVYQRLRDFLRVADRLPRPFLFVLCYGLAIPLALAKRLPHGVRRMDSLKTIAFALFDNLSPRVQTRHTVDEVRAWFEENGFSDLKQTGLIGMSGTKRL